MKLKGVRIETRRAQKIRRRLTSEAEALDDEFEFLSTYPTDSNPDDCSAQHLSSSPTDSTDHS
jgi:hypothetical protein